MKRRQAVLILTLSVLAAAAHPGLGNEQHRVTAKGLFLVSYTPETEPVPLNRMHSWIVHLRTAQGMPVEGARLEIDGGMPAHNHGLPTTPRQSADLGGGDYRVEGLRFHMPGAWEIRLRIRAGDADDSVTIPLQL